MSPSRRRPPSGGGSPPGPTGRRLDRLFLLWREPLLGDAAYEFFQIDPGVVASMEAGQHGPRVHTVDKGDRPGLLSAHIAIGVVANEALEVQRLSQLPLGRLSLVADERLQIAQRRFEARYRLLKVVLTRGKVSSDAVGQQRFLGRSHTPKGQPKCKACNERQEPGATGTERNPPCQLSAHGDQSSPQAGALRSLEVDLHPVLKNVVRGVLFVGDGNDLDPQDGRFAVDGRVWRIDIDIGELLRIDRRDRRGLRLRSS